MTQRRAEDWEQYSVLLYAEHDTKKAALRFALQGYRDNGVRLGKVWVDDVAVERQ